MSKIPSLLSGWWKYSEVLGRRSLLSGWWKYSEVLGSDSRRGLLGGRDCFRCCRQSRRSCLSAVLGKIDCCLWELHISFYGCACAFFFGWDEHLPLFFDYGVRHMGDCVWVGNCEYIKIDRPMKALNDLAKFTDPKCFKKLRCNEEQGAVGKHARERSNLRDQAGCGLERCSSRMLILAFDRAIL